MIAVTLPVAISNAANSVDHCLIDGKPDSRAQRVLDTTHDSYVEVSMSDEGFHVFGTAPKLPGRKRDGLEACSQGRFIAVTGNTLRPGSLSDLSPFWT